MAASGIEVNLPDLPELSIRLGSDEPAPLGAEPSSPATPRRTRRWSARLRDALVAYLPLLLMVALALGTWWLVKNTPGAPKPKTSAVPAGIPDYTLRGFSLQRYAPDGRLQLTLEGRQLRHFPENDRIEIEEVQLLGQMPDGARIQATARRAVANNKASEVRLLGGAEVRGKTLEGQDVQIDSEYLLYRAEARLLSTDKPVTVVLGDSRTQAGGLTWHLDSRELVLKPPVRSSLPARAQPLAAPSTPPGGPAP